MWFWVFTNAWPLWHEPSSLHLDVIDSDWSLTRLWRGPWILTICCGLRVKMSIYQFLRYSVAFLIDGISDGYTLFTIHELKPRVSFAFNLQASGRISLPLGATFSGIIETCFDEDHQREALDTVLSSLSTTHYPQPSTLRKIITVLHVSNVNDIPWINKDIFNSMP